jgi:ATP adenylyltransferase
MRIRSGEPILEDTLLRRGCQLFHRTHLFATISTREEPGKNVQTGSFSSDRQARLCLASDCSHTFTRMKYLWSPWRMEYIQSDKTIEGCAFCNELTRPDGPDNLIVFRGQNAFLILNRYPYTSGHVMIVPFKHCSDLESLDSLTRAEMMEYVNQAILILGEIYQPQGFNVGINIGEAAGAGITEHIHIHALPRWNGDTNFMSALGSTRVLPEKLKDSYQKIKTAWFRHWPLE